ncbi:MAG: HAD family hydrolase [Dysgonomonas sp.]|jgi:HAD superfamily hydrolase (TIGR01509 family)|uniref:HAD family hydrolase n=1 Tax=unclassified Dysgonomonas TaxID=2630389 RepID=UPI0025BA7593|nr:MULTISPECIES: HAD family phosphatase [unclassified Dysgonomonas]MDR1714723.1 HAD family phosphatase [Prevotella sp.]MDR2002878.1 HAD family phosphatase [Prevotella sp.]HMM04426.1 HAD family phosphatase [Dysgonomonas sp.]
MKDKFCVLFGLDGVLIDSESQNKSIWKYLGDKYGSETANPEQVVNGKSLHDILTKYFSHLSEDERHRLINELKAHEANLKIHEVKGLKQFIENLKKNGIKIGLVTNSSQTKLDNVFKQTDLNSTMDTIVSIENLSKFKSSISGFELAAKELGFEPKDCFVFENSLNTIETAHLNGMKVIALKGSLLKEALLHNTIKIISDFTEISFEELSRL